MKTRKGVKIILVALFVCSAILSTAAIAGEPVSVTISLAEVPAIIFVNEEYVAVENFAEYYWEVLVDTDNNPATGDADGFDVSFSIGHFVRPGSTPAQATFSTLQANTWMLSPGGGSYGHKLTVTADQVNNTLTLTGDSAWEELQGITENSRLYVRSYYWDAHGLIQDTTDIGYGSVTDPLNDIGSHYGYNPDITGGRINESPTVITLSSFTAFPGSWKVTLNWETGSEINTAGFNLYRAEAENGEYSKINGSLIAGKGSASQEAFYEYTDTGLQNRKTYYYRLEEIEISGRTQLYGPINCEPRLFALFNFGMKSSAKEFSVQSIPVPGISYRRGMSFDESAGVYREYITQSCPNGFGLCGCPPGDADTDGDGFCDSWELAQGIDLNGDGIIDSEHDIMLPDADPNRPDIYVQYDYMGWAEPGEACATDEDCHALGQPNEVCHEGHCNHNHKPDDMSFQSVVDAFASHGINLHIDPVHHEIPHSQVITWQKETDPLAASCAGAVPGPPGSYAVNFHELKKIYFDQKRLPAYHYAIFGHYNTCDSDLHCRACRPDRASPPGNFMFFGASGIAELPGNDFMVTLGDMFYGPYPMAKTDGPLVEAGTFMHELGHNLGLHHNGDIADPGYSPNYMSVMNYHYTYGIMTSLEVGSNIPDGQTRLDYSNSALPTLVEWALSETDGVSPLSSGNRDIIFFYNANGYFSFGAGAGPVDWNGNNVIDDGLFSIDLNDSGGSGDEYRGYADWVHGECTTSDDCPYNNILRFINHGVPTHEPCLNGRCQSLMYNFREVPWGIADAPSPPQHRASCLSTTEARAAHILFPPMTAAISAAFNAGGNLAVTLFGTGTLDAENVDVSSLKLQGAAPFFKEIRDVNNDGRPDLVLEFNPVNLKLSPGTERVTLSGWLKSSQIFNGTVNITDNTK